MKKIIIFLLSLWFVPSASIFAIQCIFAFSQMHSGKEVAWQLRTPKVENGQKVFNLLCLIEPFQVNVFEKHTVSKSFTEKILFPVAKVAGDKNASVVVGNQMKKMISQVIKKHTYDYDHTSFSVIEAGILPQAKKTVATITVNAYSSPEYGSGKNFARSIQVNTIEPQNIALSEARLNNVYDSLIADSTLNVHLIKGTATELQLANAVQVAQVMKDHSLLKQMRYVELVGTLSGETIVVTPFSLPIAPFFLLVCVVLLFSFSGSVKMPQVSFSLPRIPKFKMPKIHMPKFEKRAPSVVTFSPNKTKIPMHAVIEENSDVYKNLFLCTIILSFYTLLHILMDWRALIVMMMLFGACLLYQYFEKTDTLTYTPQEKDSETSWDILKGWSLITVILFGVIIGGALLWVGFSTLKQFLVDYEFCRWLLFGVILYIAVYEIYFHQIVIKDKILTRWKSLSYFI